MTGDVSIFIQLRKQNKGEIGLNPPLCPSTALS
jgi:hypothetical protein